MESNIRISGQVAFGCDFRSPRSLRKSLRMADHGIHSFHDHDSAGCGSSAP
ncbi:hypothetical protein NPIL_538081, partial [Nephila pilipes]